MAEFTMCRECEREYAGALNRRFRAEPTCCSKCRPQKPFTVMARDLRSAGKITYMSEKEKRLLTSFRRPIVLLEKKENKLSAHIAPQLHNVGVMLPYAGIHYLLFHYSKEPAFVMTSANVPASPWRLKTKKFWS